MAFTGTAVIKQVTDSMVRITGLSLASTANGTIGLFGASPTPGVELPDTFNVEHYKVNGQDVSFSDAIDVTVKAAAVNVAQSIPVAIVKSGSSVADWKATLTNTHASLASPDLEIYVRFHT